MKVKLEKKGGNGNVLSTYTYFQIKTRTSLKITLIYIISILSMIVKLGQKKTMVLERMEANQKTF